MEYIRPEVLPDQMAQSILQVWFGIKGSALPVLPNFVEYTLSVNFGVCTVKSFSGKIKYDIKLN